MTKKELEIRLAIAENIIKEVAYLASKEGIEKEKEKCRNQKFPTEIAPAVICHVIGNTINDYEERVDYANYHDGKDIYKFEVPTSEVELPVLEVEVEQPCHDMEDDLPFKESEVIDLEEEPESHEIVHLVGDVTREDLEYIIAAQDTAVVTSIEYLEAPEEAVCIGSISRSGEGTICVYRYRSIYVLLKLKRDFIVFPCLHE